MKEIIIYILIILESLIPRQSVAAVKVHTPYAHSQTEIIYSKKKVKRFLKRGEVEKIIVPKPVSLIAVLLGILGIVVIIISQLEFGLLMLAGLVGIGALLLGLRGLKREGRGIGAFGMFFGGVSIIIGLFALIGRLLF